jgi:hypothetical protein
LPFLIQNNIVSKYEGVMCDIGDLHNTLSQTSYDEMLKFILDKWKKDKELSDFAEYFQRQWVNSKFWNWQLFKTPVGFEMTNSPIESYDNKIKDSFTKRLKHHLKTAVEVFQCVISYESRNGKEFKSEIRIRKYMRDLAKTIVLRKQIISTSIDSEYLYKHFNPNLGFARINILSKTCTCHKYFDKGVCKHLIDACMLNNISLPGMAELPKKILVLRRRQKVRYQDESILEENIETNEVVTTNESVHAIVATDEVQQGPKKRGRKPKIPSQTIQSTIDKGGRPPLVRHALVYDTVEAVAPVRRSQRNKKNL